MDKRVRYVIESDIVASGATNIEVINGSMPILCGAGMYVSGAVSYYNKWSDLIVCIGDENDDVNMKEMRSIYKKKLLSKKVRVHFFENTGKNFMHFISTQSEDEKKDYGDYLDFFVDGLSVRAKYLILGTGAPKYQKSILRSSTVSELIAWDSKSVYYETQIENLLEFLSLINMYSATSEEIRILLNYLKVSEPYELFGMFDNLQYVIYKEGAIGGSLYVADGTCYDYKVVQRFAPINTCGAGDILLGGLIGGMNFWGKENIAFSLKNAAELATKSVLVNGMEKLDIDSYGNTINISLRKWKSA